MLRPITSEFHALSSRNLLSPARGLFASPPPPPLGRPFVGEMIAATLRPCGRFLGGERSPGVAFPTEKTRRNAPALRVWGESDDGMPSGSIFVAVRFGLRGRSLSVIELGDVGS